MRNEHELFHEPTGMDWIAARLHQEGCRVTGAISRIIEYHDHLFEVRKWNDLYHLYLNDKEIYAHPLPKYIVEFLLSEELRRFLSMPKHQAVTYPDLTLLPKSSNQ